MGAMNKLIRSIRHIVDDFLGLFSRKQKKTRKQKKSDPIKVPRSWNKKKPSRNSEKPVIIHENKVRIPGLRLFHQILAGLMLLINLVFSQFLLGSIGNQAQPMFLIFVLNAYLIARLLWSYRKKEDSE